MEKTIYIISGEDRDMSIGFIKAFEDREEAISLIFPISTENISTLIDINVSDKTINSIVYQSLLKNVPTTFEREKVKLVLTYWYNLFSHIQFFENFNSLLGNIVINIFSYILTNKYLIQNND